jgi:hypothetical protein
MQTTARAPLACLMLGASLYAQKTAEIDLTQPPVPNHPVQQQVIPEDCVAPQYANSDGVIVNSNERQKLEIDVSLLNRKIFAPGDRVRAEIKMYNRGSEAIEIPWTTDSRLSSQNATATERQYDLGWFEAEIRAGPKASTVPLESESVSAFLYSSPSAPGTSLRLKPQESVVVKFDFILE